MQREPQASPSSVFSRVHARRAERDRGGVLEVARPRRDLGDAKAEVGGLEQDLGVEGEVERVAQEGDLEQQPARVGAVAGVQLREVRPHDPVLDRRQAPVGQVLVDGASRPRAPGARLGQARAQHEVGLAAQDRRDQLGDQRGLVLAVGVQHHHDVGVALERLQVTGLLVAAVADVVRVPDDVQRQPARDLDRLVGGLVVDEDDLVDPLAGDRRVGLLERARGVARRHHHDHLPRRPLSHGAPPRRRSRPGSPRPRRPRTPRRRASATAAAARIAARAGALTGALPGGRAPDRVVEVGVAGKRRRPGRAAIRTGPGRRG